MREIKFRVWNDHLKAHSTLKGERFYYEPLNEEHIELFAKYKKYLFCGNSLVLEQYTGLKDKNGVEIYEGDIVEVEEKEYQYNEVMTNKYYATVVFREGCFKLVEENGLMDMVYNKVNKCKVVGNIHDGTSR